MRFLKPLHDGHFGLLKIEHRLFPFIASNWRGQPLRDYETVVNRITRTTTAKRLKVTCRLDLLLAWEIPCESQQ